MDIYQFYEKSPRKLGDMQIKNILKFYFIKWT